LEKKKKKASSKPFERIPKDFVQLIKEKKEAQGFAAFTPFFQNLLFIFYKQKWHIVQLIVV